MENNNLIICYIIIIIYIIIICKFKKKRRNEIIECSKVDNRCYRIKNKYNPKSYRKAADILAFLKFIPVLFLIVAHPIKCIPLFLSLIFDSILDNSIGIGEIYI